MLHPLLRDCTDVDSLWSYFVIRYVTVLSMNNKEGAELSVHIHANRHRDFDVLQCDKDPKFSTSPISISRSHRLVVTNSKVPWRESFER